MNERSYEIDVFATFRYVATAENEKDACDQAEREIWRLLEGVDQVDPNLVYVGADPHVEERTS